MGAGNEEDGGEELGDGEVVLAVGVAAHTALETGAVAGEKRQVAANLRDAFGGFDGGANGGGVKRGDGTEAYVEEKLRWRCVGCFVVVLLRVDVADKDSLAHVGGGGLAKFGGLGVCLGCCAGNVESGDAAVEPEAGYVGEVDGGDVGVEVEHDTDVVAAGLMDEVVEIVEGAVGGVDGLGVRGVGLDGGEEEDVGAERLDVFEALGDAVEAAACWDFVDGGTEVEGVHFVDDGLLPPDVGVDAVADPAGASEGLGVSGCGESGGETEGEKSTKGQCGHRAIDEMLREVARCWMECFAK